MSARTQRRAAELAVIDEARQLIGGIRWGGAADGLERALKALDAIALPAPNRARANKAAPVTAKQAAVWMNGEKALSLAGEVFGYIYRRGGAGATTEEIEDRLQGKHQTISPRVNELAETGWILDSGRTRPTRSNRQAIVWYASRAAGEAVREGRGL